MSPPKYRNKKVVVNGAKFDSIAEGDRYKELVLLMRANEIQELKLKPKFIIQNAFELRGLKHRAITYTADYSYYDKQGGVWVFIIEDCKSKPTLQSKSFRVSMKLLLKRHGDYFIFRLSQRAGKTFKTTDY